MTGSKGTLVAGIDPGSLKKIRALFWFTGIVCGVITLVTTRHFFNTDGLTYIEMGEGLRQAHWPKLVNLACSPLYAVLLGIAQIILNTDPLNELATLKVVGFANLLLAMGACDLMISLVRRASIREMLPGEALRWFPNVATISYALFLVASLVWVKLRLMNPDMLVLFFVLMCVNIILWIRLDPCPLSKWVALGTCVGLGYLAKTYVLLFSPVLFGLAALSCGPMKKCLSRVLLSVSIALLVAAPLIAALSLRSGKFSIGEVGTLAYTTVVAGKGTATHAPEVLSDKPKVLLYEYAQDCTDLRGFDVGYWNLGMKPSLDLGAQLKTIWGNLRELYSESIELWAALLVWFLYLVRLGAVKPGGFRVSRVSHVLLLPGLCGLALFSLVHLESRYVAPFLFLAFLGALLWPKYDLRGPKMERQVLWATRILVVVILIVLGHSLVGQNFRGFRSSEDKVSYDEAFSDFLAVKDFLELQGLSPGARVSIVGWPPNYWARMAQMKVAARVPDSEEFLLADNASRKKALDAMAQAGIKAVVAKGTDFGVLIQEGWQKVPRTTDYFVFVP